MRFGAIELFVDRATATLDTYVFEDADVEPVVDICRRLDGIPLAIELVAAFVSSLGVRDIRTALTSRFLEGRPGRRTAIPRHRTLRSTVDWSYGLLSPFQRTVLARITLFCSSFTLDSAGVVASDSSSTPVDVFDAVMELAGKSLLVVDVSSDPTYFRLPETTRRYASIRLLESGELPALRRRHAEHMIELLRESEQDGAMPSPSRGGTATDGMSMTCGPRWPGRRPPRAMPCSASCSPCDPRCCCSSCPAPTNACASRAPH
jgi:predicted ATPase